MRAAVSWFAGIATVASITSTALVGGAAWAQQRAGSDTTTTTGRPAVAQAARPVLTQAAQPVATEAARPDAPTATPKPLARAATQLVPRPEQPSPPPGATPPPPRQIDMPDLRGSTCDQARETLRRYRARLDDCPIGTPGGRYAAGTINRQSIEPGARVTLVPGVAPLAGLRVALQPVPRSESPSSPSSPTKPAEPTPRPDPNPSKPPRTLPNLLGLTCDQAERALAALDTRAARCEVGAAVSGARPGRINAQSRPPGTRLPIRPPPLQLSVQPAVREPEPVVVPGLVGQGEAQALGLLAARGLQSNANGPAAALGRRVLAQAPPEGTRVRPGATVGLRLGLTVPSLRGLSCAGARELAARHGHDSVQCDARPADSPARALDRVFEQAPESSLPPQGAAVAIRVAVWAAQPVTVPDVRRQRLPDASHALRAAKLVPQPDATTGDRDVSTQTPAPGSVVNAGSGVRLTTVPMAPVPDVVGLSLDDALGKLTTARFAPRADASDDAANRRVAAQSPRGGTRARQGSPVALTTKRFADLPPLAGKTCEEARRETRDRGLELACDAEDSWRTRVFGAPRIDALDPPARGRVEVGSAVRVSARAPLPPALQWLERVPLPAAVAGVCAPLLGFALFLFLRWPLNGPSAAPPLHAPTHWRVEPDAAPSVTLRRPAVGAAEHSAPAFAWHVVPDEARVTLREHDAGQPGADHAHD